jgi:hypothetical protein
VIEYIIIYIVAFSLITILIYTLDWLQRNFDYVISALSRSISLIGALLIGYLVFTSSLFVFLKSIEVDPKGIKIIDLKIGENVHSWQ